MAVNLKPFDPAREFKALRFFRYDGKIIERGDPFDIASVPDRKARTLYETRFIGYADEDQVRQYPPKPPAQPADQAPRTGKAGGDDQPELTREELIKKLTNRYKLDTLVKAAKGLKGLSEKPTKAELVAALLDAGKASADGLA